MQIVGFLTKWLINYGYSVLTCTKQNVGGTHILFCAKIRILQPGRVQFPYEELSVRKLHCNQRTIGPENAHLKPDLGVLSHHEMTLTLNTHTPLLTSQVVCICKVSGLRLQ